MMSLYKPKTLWESLAWKKRMESTKDAFQYSILNKIEDRIAASPKLYLTRETNRNI